MSTNKMLDKLDAEIEELEKEMYPDPAKLAAEKLKEEGEEVIVDDEVIIDDDEVIPEPKVELEDEDEDDLKQLGDEEVVVKGSEEELEEEKKPKRKSWKSEHELLTARYNGLRAATDSKLFHLRNQNASLLTEAVEREGRITELQNQLVKVNANTDIYADIFTEEDVDVLGEDAIGVFKKANAKSIEIAMAPLRDQLEAAKNQSVKSRQVEADTLSKQAYNDFLARLGDMVPDYTTLNTDAGFVKYMAGVEDGAGKTRKEELGEFVASGNTRMAATFFNDYKALVAQPASKLEEKLLPDNSNASDTIVKAVVKKKLKTYPWSEIEKFYDDQTRGKYNRDPKTRELGEKLDKMYDRAIEQGRVIY